MENYQTILNALKRSEQPLRAIMRSTGLSQEVVQHALDVLTLENKVVRYGARYKLKEKRNGKAYA
ncbi:MAG: hypothetical protein ABJP08_28855 [Roseibium sp.]